MQTFYMIMWIVIMVIALLVEAANFALLSIWFALGALAAFASSLLGAGIGLQTAVFLTVSVLTLIVTRPVLKKLMPKDYVPTNGELDLGKTAVVIEEINSSAGKGRVRLDGVDWGAVSDDGTVIAEGISVIVVDKGAAYLKVRQEKKT